MYVRKSILGAATAIIGFIILAVLAVMFSFMQTDIPAAVYAAAWFGCLWGMAAAFNRIFR